MEHCSGRFHPVWSCPVQPGISFVPEVPIHLRHLAFCFSENHYDKMITCLETFYTRLRTIITYSTATASATL